MKKGAVAPFTIDVKVETFREKEAVGRDRSRADQFEVGPLETCGQHEWLTIHAVTIMNTKMNCVALTSAQAPADDICRDGTARPPPATRRLRVVDALLHELPPERGNLALCGLEVEQ